jgi:hypothetical protein
LKIIVFNIKYLRLWGLWRFSTLFIVYRLKETQICFAYLHLAFKFKVDCSRYGHIVRDKIKIS